MVTRPAGDTLRRDAAIHGKCVSRSATAPASTVASRCPTRSPLRARISPADTFLAPTTMISETVKNEDSGNAAAVRSTAIATTKRSRRAMAGGAGGAAGGGGRRRGGRGYAGLLVCGIRGGGKNGEGL